MDYLGIDLSCAIGSLRDGKFPEKDCLLPLISKLLGYLIVAASTTVKLPQILKILKHRSVRGLSVTAFELEVVGYTITLAYCVHKGLPFSAFGEYAFLLIQEQKYRGAQLPNMFYEFWRFHGESFYKHAGESSYKCFVLDAIPVVVGSALGMITNGTILSQIVLYHKSEAKKEKKKQ
ncbi:hypothetical protein Tsubulata_036933 [Turnera subulata]|uniref:Mannose-P-dolichol utilization defect 1 protein homolog n=1 Tax=Turnera subulata TaxID=218843 RepID=A0A9Q0J5B5_9ROSI|nr:hypothetical protein Tsubulata_036933 [Turnera subulata]